VGRVGLRVPILLAVLCAAAAALYVRGLHSSANFDEGVYLASLDALRHGQALGTHVDIPQPPGFYVLLQALGAIFGNSVEGVRIGFLLLALVGLVLAYLAGHAVAGEAGGIGAAALLAITHPYPTQAAQVEADTISTVLALGAIVVLMTARRRTGPALASGALAGAALSVKLLAAPVLAPLTVLVIARRAPRQAVTVAAGAAAVVAVLLLRYSYALGDLWQSVVVEHSRAQDIGGPGLGDNAHRVLLHPLDWHTPAGVLVPIGLVAVAVLGRRLETVALGAWIVASAAFLVYQRPLLDHHLVLLATALAVPAGAGLGAVVARLPRPAAAAATAALALAFAAAFVQEHRRLAGNDVRDSREVRWAVAELREATRPDELVATDLPIVPYLADRRVEGQLIDSSYGRLNTQTLTTQEILDVLDRRRIRAVLVGRNYRKKPDLIAALNQRFPTRLRAGDITLYLRRAA